MGVGDLVGVVAGAVVAGLVGPIYKTAIVVADARVSDRADVNHFDIWQKVVRLGDDGFFGFAGPINQAADTAHWIAGTYKKLGVNWLSVESDVIDFLSDIGILRQADRNSFLFAFMDEESWATLVRFSTDG